MSDKSSAAAADRSLGELRLSYGDIAIVRFVFEPEPMDRRFDACLRVSESTTFCGLCSEREIDFGNEFGPS